jgi:Phage portal protein, SPP1 Gp6-like
MSLLHIPQLSETDQNTLSGLLNQLEDKTPRNKVRSEYYNSRNLFKDLGISTPPKFRNFEAVLGWPAKAVDALSRRVHLDGFVIPGQTQQDLGVDVLWDDNRMDIEAPQAHDAALIHSCAFVTTIRGDTESGEPPVLMMVRDAFNSTGLWNPRKRGFTAGLSIIEREVDGGSPMYLVMYLPDRVLVMSRDVVGGKWRIESRVNPLGRVPMEPLAYRPHLDRPFGRSRINRRVMYLTDAATRTVVRSEIGAEFYTTPQRYGLNIPEEAFAGGGWKAVTGRIFFTEPPTLDENADPGFKPEVGQFPQMTMQPHTEQLRQWATLFAGETSIPVGSLGIVQDNPSSAEAINQANADLVLDAEVANLCFGAGWVKAMQNALMVRDNLSELPDEWRRLRAKWRNPKTPSQAERADAMTKQIAALPWLADSEVALEELGYDRTDIERLLADKRKSNVSTLLTRIASGGVPAGTPVPPEPGLPASPV